MKTATKTLMLIAVLAFVAAPATADWDWDDGHKMHYPQLPDPDGWDVCLVHQTIADDFMCTQTGPILDVHFWASWRSDDVLWPEITNLHLSLHKDIPKEESTSGYSMPGEELWRYDTLNFRWRDPDFGDQGWYCPIDDFWQRPDHQQFFQINVLIPESEAYTQQEGTIYWLDIRVDMIEDQNPPIGWKTSQDHWNDDAVFWHPDLYGTGEGGWVELRDPEFPEMSLDMAFVITPEPGTMSLLILGGIGVLMRRRRK